MKRNKLAEQIKEQQELLVNLQEQVGASFLETSSLCRLFYSFVWWMSCVQCVECALRELH